MIYDFDRVLDRHTTCSIKHDRIAPGGRADAVPLWIADMDFAVPQQVVEALTSRSEHGLFGYTFIPESYYEAVCGWFMRRKGWKIEPEWFVMASGVMSGICTAVQAFTEPGDAVMIQQPVYDPFAFAVEDNRRRPVHLNLVRTAEGYFMDFEEMERLIVANKVKMFLLCNPHNPTGRVWTREELNEVARICEKHGVLVVADEIHCDFIYKPHQYTHYASLSEQTKMNSIVCTAPSKTFGLPGLCTANIIIANPALREKFEAQKRAMGNYGISLLGPVAAEAAYRYGEEWFDQLLAYLQKNVERSAAFCREHLPQLKFIPPQATYLLWLDFSFLGLPQEGICKAVWEDAGVWLHNGGIYGNGSEGFMRMNVASPWSVVEEGWKRLADIFAK